MRGIILAAGRGSRMGNLTDSHPKCLIKLAGKTLLDWQISAMRHSGIREIVVIAGYRAESLISRDYHVLKNPRWSETNMLRSLTVASKLLMTEECIVSYADIAYHPDTINQMLDSTGDIAITFDLDWQQLWERRFQTPLEDAETFQYREGNLVEIGQKANSVKEIQGQYIGLLKFTPTGWHQVRTSLSSLDDKDIDQLDMTSMLRRLIRENVPVKAIPVSGRWCEVDSESDLKLYNSLLLNGKGPNTRWHHDWRW